MNRQKVLVIDDSTMIHALVRARLADEPIELVFSSSAMDGLKIAATNAPDLILLDIDMPRCDGFEACRKLKADPATANIPVIFLSGASDSQQKVQGLDLGAIDYITKPFDPAELRARVRAALRTKFLVDLLAQRAMIDGLTGLWNRACFEQRLEQELSLSRRTGRPVACLMIDVDHFKAINDNYGHPFGDDVLRDLARILLETIRSEDLVCRYGGEEFVLLLPNTPASSAIQLADRLREKIAEHGFMLRKTRVRVTVSIGAADNLQNRSEQMVALADRALYAAKRAGRNCCRNGCDDACDRAA